MAKRAKTLLDNRDEIPLDANLLATSKELYDLIAKTLGAGMPQNELAKGIGIQVVVLSNLKNYVLPSIVSGKVGSYRELEECIKDRRCMKANIYLDFGDIIEKINSYITKQEFQERHILQEKSTFRKWKDNLPSLVDSSAVKLAKQGYMGLYNIYTCSSLDSVKVSRMPMLIRKSEHDNSIEVFTGNKESDYQYEGFAIMLESHSLHITLADYFGGTNEIVNILFFTPHLRNPSFLRGCLLAVDRSRQPFSTRIVAVRKGEVVEKDLFDKLASKHIDAENQDEEWEKHIVHYLQGENYSSLRFQTFSSPQYDLNVLVNEKEWIIENHSKMTEK
jgi:hypothetical protein